MLIDFGSRLDLRNDVRPWQPTRLRPRAAERARRLSARRMPLELVEGLELSLSPGGTPRDWSEFGAPVELMFSAAGEIGYLRTVTPLLQRLLAHGEMQMPAGEMDAELAALLIEAVLMERVEQLEGLIGSECKLLRIARIEDHPGLADLDLTIAQTGSGQGYPGTVYASAPLLAALARLWEERPLRGFDPSPLRFTLASRAAYIDLTAKALSALGVGDAMLFDRVALAGGAAIVLQERFHAPAIFDAEGALALTEPFARTDFHAFGDFLMEQDDETRPAEALSEAAVEDLPVRLVFEIGRMELSLDEVRRLSVGTPLPLSRATSSAVDILANGRKIGAAEMVMIGDQLGVRVTRLVGHG